MNIREIFFFLSPEIIPKTIKIPSRVIILIGRNKTIHCPIAVIPINPVRRKLIKGFSIGTSDGIKL